MAGYYTEEQFTAPNLAPPEGHVWLWYDYDIGKVGWVKISHTDSNDLDMKAALRAINNFYLELNTPRDVDGRVLTPSDQRWVIDSIKRYPDYNYTLFKIQIDISSNAVTSLDIGSLGGDGFNFSASGDEIWHASASGTVLNPVLATDVTSSVPQGYFPNTSTYPTEQTFRGYAGANYYSEYQVFSTIGGSITDSNNNFQNGRVEVNNAFSTSYTVRAGANQIPWFMNDRFRLVEINEDGIDDESPIIRDQLRQLAGFYIARSGLSTDNIPILCESGNFDNINGGKLSVISSSPLLEESRGRLLFRNSAGDTTINTEEEIRTRQNNNSWSPLSIIKAGTTLSTLADGNYPLSVNVGNNTSVIDNRRAVLQVQDNRIRGVYYCPAVFSSPMEFPEFSLRFAARSSTTTTNDYFDVGSPSVSFRPANTSYNIFGMRAGVYVDVPFNSNPYPAFARYGSSSGIGNGPLPIVQNLVRQIIPGRELTAGRAVRSQNNNESLALVFVEFTPIGSHLYASIGLMDGTRNGFDQYFRPAPEGEYRFRLTGTNIVEPVEFDASLTRHETGAYSSSDTIRLSDRPTLTFGNYNIEVISQP